MPAVSLIIPTRNRERLLGATLDSVRLQTLADWEVLVVDDGSTDGTETLVKGLASRDPRIRYLSRPTGSPSGAPACRNVGLRNARAAYVIFLDSDDVITATCLERRMAGAATHGEVDAMFSQVEIFKAEPGDLGIILNVLKSGDLLDRYLSHDYPWFTASGLWKRDFLMALGGWDEKLLRLQDTDLHFRAIVAGMTYKDLPVRDVFWRVSGEDRISRQPGTDIVENTVYLVRKWTDLLEAKQQITPPRARHLLGWYFSAGSGLSTSYRRKEACALWHRATIRLGAPRWMDWAGNLHFRLPHVRNFSRGVLKWLFPEEIFPDPKTLLRFGHGAWLAGPSDVPPARRGSMSRQIARRIDYLRDRLTDSRPDPRFREIDRELREKFVGGRESYEHLFRYFLTGQMSYSHLAGVRYPGAASQNGRVRDSLEGTARFLPVVAAWLAGSRPAEVATLFDEKVGLIPTYASRIARGCDPALADYWGAIGHFDQKIVEACDVALSLWIGDKVLWNALAPEERRKVSAWLNSVNAKYTHDNNWHLFPILVNLVLRALGEPHDLEASLARYERLKEFYLGGGWFSDGPARTGKGRVDYYNAWGIHYLLEFISRIDPSWDAAFLEDAREKFRATYRYFFSPQGVPMFGRSVCYRLGVSVPLVAAGLRRPLDVTWEYFVRNGALNAGVPTQGYFGADLSLLDNYSGPASSLWGLRSLSEAFLHRPESPFWTDVPAKLPIEEGDFEVEIPSLRWKILGEEVGGRIVVRFPSRKEPLPSLMPYGWEHWARSYLRGHPLRPNNHAFLYERGEYSTTTIISR